MARPDVSEYGTFFGRYVNYPSGDDVLQILENSVEPIREFFRAIPEDKAGYAYAEGKWTIRQLMQHIIDTERIFAYRALCIARGEKQGLPGFEENDYAENAPSSDRTIADLLEELLLVRQTSIMLFKHLSKNDLLRFGTASGHPITPNALGFIMAGHVMHHQKMLTDRYLSAIGANI